MSNNAKFWDKHADGYAKKPVPDEQVYQKKLEITQSYFKPEMKLLEFGCGTGSTSIVHAPQLAHIDAIDISPRMIEIAQGKAEKSGISNISFEVKTIEELEPVNGVYDMVLGLSILHLLEDKEAAVAKVYKLLKPNGYFVTSTVCLGDTMKIFKFIAPVGKRLGLMPLLKVFTVQQLVDSITAAGFTIDHQWQPDKKAAVFIVAKKGG